MPEGLVAVGEVGLGGELRQAPQTARRLGEAARLGFRAAVVPASTPDVAGHPPAARRAHRRRAHEPRAPVTAATARRFAADAEVRDALRDPSGSADTVPFRPVEIGGGAGIVPAASTDTSARRAQWFARRPQPEDLPVPPAARSEAMLSALRLVAPGRPLREGLDRILQAKMGALIVIGDGPDVLSLCSGGFLLDAEFTPQRLSELAKMDGAMILSADCTRIARANVHLVPDPEIPTSETGTRHRTAERVAKQIDAPVLSVSEELSLVAVHRKGQKRTLEPVARVLTRADQALQILERYKTRLDAVSNSLSALEIEDLVTVRDIAVALQRAEMVRRIAEEIEEYVIELGQDGRLILLQLEELMGGVEDDRRLFAKDYVVAGTGADATGALGVLVRARHREPARRPRGRRRAAPPARHGPRHRGPGARLPPAPQDPAAARARRRQRGRRGSATCRRSCARACPTSSRSRASASRAPGRSRTVWPASPSRRSSSATSEPSARVASVEAPTSTPRWASRSG